MPVLTREQRDSTHKQIKRRLESHNYEGGISGNLLDAADATIEYFPIDDDDEEVPDPNEVILFLHEHLMPTQLLLIPSILQQPLFPIITLRLVGKLFGFGDADEQWLNAVNLDAADRQSPKLMPIVWLCWLMKSSPEVASSFAKKFKSLNKDPIPLVTHDNSESHQDLVIPALVPPAPPANPVDPANQPIQEPEVPENNAPDGKDDKGCDDADEVKNLSLIHI